MNKTKTFLKEMSVAALFSAVLCVISPFSVPVINIPVSAATFAVMLCAFTQKPLWAVLSTAVYLFIGFCGLPVFSSFCGGPSILFGPTGGYLWGYIPLSLFCSLAVKVSKSTFKIFLFTLLGMLSVYTLGTIQYCAVTKSTVLSSVVICILPFIIFDILKAITAFTISKKLKSKL